MAQAYYNTSSTGASFSPLTADMVGAASSNHSHGMINGNFFSMVANTTTNSGWSMLDANYAGGGNFLKAVRCQQYAPSWLEGNFASGVAAGGGDTKFVITGGYNNRRITVAGGNGTKPAWYWKLSGANGGNYDLSTFASSSNPEIVVSSSQPTNSNAKLWVKV